MDSVDAVLSKSAKALATYQKEMSQMNSVELDTGSTDVQLASLMSVLTNAKVEINRVLAAKDVVRINKKTMKAIEDAIILMLETPTTEDKVNAVQLILFGTNIPFWKVLRDVQHLIRVVRQLNEERGIRVTKSEKSRDM